MGYSVIFITVPNKKEAEKIAKLLLKEKLIACVNIINGLKSYYWWQNKIENSKELLLIIKTKEIYIDSIIKKVKEIHSYTVPEIISMQIKKGNKDYLSWIDDSLK